MGQSGIVWYSLGPVWYCFVLAGVSLILFGNGWGQSGIVCGWGSLALFGIRWASLVLFGIGWSQSGIVWYMPGQSGIVGYWLESVLYCLILAGASPVL